LANPLQKAFLRLLVGRAYTLPAFRLAFDGQEQSRRPYPNEIRTVIKLVLLRRAIGQAIPHGAAPAVG